MKICILTLPLLTNYGGLLQAYALTHVLDAMGHEAYVEDRIADAISKKEVYKDKFRWLMSYVPFQNRYTTLYTYNGKWDRYIRRHTEYFKQKYIRMTCRVTGCDKSALTVYGFDAYAVGSDQVWRYAYSPGIMNYFLDFTAGQPVKRVAYSASFGTDKLDIPPELVPQCAALLQQFNAVSVREDSGIALCSEHFHTQAVQTLDPTLLLDAPDYMSLVRQENAPLSRGSLFCYVLDDTPQMGRLVALAGEQLHLKPFTVKPEPPYASQRSMLNPLLRKRYLQGCTVPPVTTWIRAFMDAQCVITDSFHGCAFSILFNKPFWVIGNRRRGMSRFTSLLRLFGLEDRLLEPGQIPDFSAPIDWEAVNALRAELKEQSVQFLRQNL